MAKSKNVINAGPNLPYNRINVFLQNEVAEWESSPKRADEQVVPTLSEQLNDLVRRVERASSSGATLLLTGESGTGKTRMARLVHELSPVRAEPFLAFSCDVTALWPPMEMESELFGHVKDAFAGAGKARDGRLSVAGNGTLLLDDIDALPLITQVKLLRAMNEGVFEPLGSNQPQPLKARLIGTTRLSLKERVEAGCFHTDLYQRLALFTFRLQPLRQCPSAIFPLATSILNESAARNGRPVKGISAEALALLEGYHWPGNIRELRNVIECAVCICPGAEIQPSDLPEALRSPFQPSGDERYIHIPPLNDVEQADTSSQPADDNSAPFVDSNNAEQIQLIASQDTTLLIGGEPGTGKTRLARRIHELSPRRDQPFLIIDCEVLPPDLIETEMFGHVKGAFPGANRTRAGKFASAGSGTIVLDNVHALPLAVQRKLLPTLQERVFQPLGSNEDVPLRARLIVTSSRPLESEVEAGRFRPDLFYALNVIAFHLPPLRDSLGRIRQLVPAFLKDCAAGNGRPLKGISAAALALLETYEWPDNIRQLRNVIERAATHCSSPTIELSDLDEALHYSPVFHRFPKYLQEENEKSFLEKVLEEAHSEPPDVVKPPSEESLPPPIEDTPPKPSAELQQTPEQAKAAFDKLVQHIAADREQQAARLQPVFSTYLRRWDEEQQRLTRENKGRPAEQIAQAKQTLAENVKEALERLDLSIYRDGQACNLLVHVTHDHKRGVFWLKPKGSGGPLDHKANLSDLFNFREGDPQLGVAPPRREPLADWHKREKARRKTKRSAALGD
jgi:DNA-binding NtrC family response regulator